MEEDIIYAIVCALKLNYSIEQIHDAMIKKGYSEEQIFLAIKAGEILFKDIKCG